MPFIDWSDPEGLLDLLVEFIADETNDCREDPQRKWFLQNLLRKLEDLRNEFATANLEKAIIQLKAIRDAIDPEFIEDPAAIHLNDCIEELQRLSNDAA